MNMDKHIEFDIDKNEIIKSDGSNIPLFSEEGFKILSDLWLLVGWDQKHLYSFSWLGRPIIQIPDDMVRIQEVIFSLKPDYIIETGIAHGGSLVFYATLCKALGKGEVIGIDIDIRKHNRKAIEEHFLFDYITLIEGDSTAKEVFNNVSEIVNGAKTVIVILDSYHAYEHVYNELELYSQLVSVGSYIVVCDGSQKYLTVSPRANKDYTGYVDTWDKNNPIEALSAFLETNNNFIIEEPEFLFNEGNVNFRITHWPKGFLKRVKKDNS